MSAEFQTIEAGNLFAREGSGFYRVTPAKGARVDATVSVGVSSHDVDAYFGDRREKVTAPAMWVDYTPFHADTRSTREIMTVNGREYGEGFGGSVSGRVEFMPADHYAHLAKYYPAATVDGREYYLRATISQFDSVTDKARELLNGIAAEIAAEYVTDARWHAFQVSQAEYRVARATEARNEAQAKLDVAQAALEALQA